jgi:glycerol-3-phosphate dehydrogenase
VNRAAVKTARLSREHLMEVSPSGLITIAGGKWTTYRKMAQDTIDKAQQVANLPSAPSRTKDLRVHDVPLVPDLQHAIEREMARTIEDLLARRKRTLFIDVAAARREAASAAAVLAQTLGRDDVWHAQELQAFDAISQGYGRW